MKTVIDRLKEKYTIEENGCWRWHGATSGKGKWVYGLMQYNGKLTPAHKVAYLEMIGPYQEGLDLDHLCRNTLCVNPHHVEPVTHQENLRRGYDLKSHKTHCINGHSLCSDNVYIKIRNGREGWECRTCRAAQVIKSRSKK